MSMRRGGASLVMLAMCVGPGPLSESPFVEQDLLAGVRRWGAGPRLCPAPAVTPAPCLRAEVVGGGRRTERDAGYLP
jgi:hypothetical protein